MNKDSSASAFSFKADTRLGATIISLTGTLSDESNRKAKEEFLQVIKNPPRRMVVDLSRIDYISSSGIALLVAILCRCRQISCGMSICGLRSDTQELFRLTRISQVFEIYEDVNAALKVASV